MAEKNVSSEKTETRTAEHAMPFGMPFQPFQMPVQVPEMVRRSMEAFHTRAEAAVRSQAELEHAAIERCRQTVEESARLATAGLAWWGETGAAMRKLALDSMRQVTESVKV